VWRKETRSERYIKKANNAVTLPISFATIYFRCDENLAFLIRTAACFGIRDIHVIGTVPQRNEIHSLSGSLTDFVNLHQYSNPSDLLNYTRENNICLISAEIANDSSSLYEYEFDLERETIIILGNEISGIPTELAINSKIIHIPMLGSGYCLNTSQTGTAFISEYTRQYITRV
jgi:tRNA G18 (ribose-2'-O)-methylase SpoU